MTEANIYGVSVGKVLIAVYSCKVSEVTDFFLAMDAYAEVLYGKRGNTVISLIGEGRTLVTRKVHPPI